MRLPLIDSKLIKGTKHGQIEGPIKTLMTGEQTWEQVSLLVTSEYARVIAEFPEYEFGIIGDNVQGTLRITWKLRE